MNIKTLSLALIVTSLALGCFDEPRKIKLKGSTFDSIAMRASSNGLNVDDTYNVYYNLQKRSWCINNYRANTEKCNVRQQTLLDNRGLSVGLMTFDNVKKKMTIQQVFARTAIQGPSIEITNESDPLSIEYGYDRYSVKALNTDGSLLGELKAAHMRGSKGALGEEEKPEVDLSKKVLVSSGCGGSSDSNAGKPHKPDVTFEVDDQEQHQ